MFGCISGYVQGIDNLWPVAGGERERRASRIREVGVARTQIVDDTLSTGQCTRVRAYDGWRDIRTILCRRQIAGRCSGIGTTPIERVEPPLSTGAKVFAGCS